MKYNEKYLSVPKKQICDVLAYKSIVTIEMILEKKLIIWLQLLMSKRRI